MPCKNMNKYLILPVWIALAAGVAAIPVWAEGSAKKDEMQGSVSTTAPEEHVPSLKQDRVFSSVEVQVLQELEQKKVDLERRAQALELREKLVDMLEKRLAEKVADMNTLKAELEAQMKSLSGKEEKDLGQLSQMYGAMKPTAAASVLNRLDNLIVHDVLVRMPVKKSGKIMEVLDPVKARYISEMIAAKAAPLVSTSAAVTP